MTDPDHVISNHREGPRFIATCTCGWRWQGGTSIGMLQASWAHHHRFLAGLATTVVLVVLGAVILTNWVGDFTTGWCGTATATYEC